MSENEYRLAVNDAIYLCGCLVNNIIPDLKVIKLNDWSHIYKVANRHMLTAMTGMALKDAGVSDPTFNQAIAVAQRKTVILNEEKRQVFAALDSAGIWHMALKGTIIRDWYPRFAMRESADCDILFDKTREQDVKEIMGGLGYTVQSYGNGHHDVYFKKPVTNMQMHVALFGVGFEKQLNDYYEDVYDRLEGTGFEKHFRPEDFYIYVLAHNHRDYTNGGCGLRSLLDTYVILKHFDFDWDYVEKETDKLQIHDFEEANRSLALHLFGGEKLTEEDVSRLEYMVMAGTYGTVENTVTNKVERHGGGSIGKIKYLQERLILPLDVVKHSYPVFYNYKVLLPFLPFYRMFRGLTTNRKKLKAELKALK